MYRLVQKVKLLNLKRIIMENIEVNAALNWRYATKRMNGIKVPEKEISEILESVRLAPSSRGLQPFKVLVVRNQELKDKIRKVADNQAQVSECSHLLIFCSWKKVSQEMIDDFIHFSAQERGIPVEKLDKMKSMLIKDQLNMSEDEFYHWASKQIYIALGFALIASALKKIDAAPMEGFDPIALDNLLELHKTGLKSSVLLAIGYRDIENDWMTNLKKVRRSDAELFKFLD
jgi:nitroreductase / dihydropteridine reductase